MTTDSFVFVGYLIQEPYWREWPKRDGYRVASIEREYHPEFNRHQWNQIGGVDNPTRFLTELPRLEHLKLEPHKCRSLLHKENPGWVVSGYGFSRNVVEMRKLISNDRMHEMTEFAYALNLNRGPDGLSLLGYEVTDRDDLFLSILNNCGYTSHEVKEMAGPLNEYSLLSSITDAQKFTKAIKSGAQNPPTIIPDHNQGIIVEVWGAP